MINMIAHLRKSAPALYEIVKVKKLAKLNEKLVYLRFEYKNSTSDVDKREMKRKADEIKAEIAQFNEQLEITI